MEKLTLKAARINRGLTQKELANIMGVHENTVANWEKDPKKLTILEAENLCSVLKVPFKKIFFG